jgi:hypothetical protein
MQKYLKTYNDALEESRKEICDELAKIISKALPEHENKLWHGSPVWFDDGNPIVGYDNLKNGVRLLFWSGQSFDEKVLQPEGTFKAAEIRFTNVEELKSVDITGLLEKAKNIQWDYKNIVKRRGELVRIK